MIIVPENLEYKSQNISFFCGWILNLRFSLWHQNQSPEVICRKGVLKNFAIFIGKHMCRSLFLIKLSTCSIFKNRLPTQVLSFKCGEIFKNTYFEKYLWTGASVALFVFQTAVVNPFTSLFYFDTPWKFQQISRIYWRF